MDFDLNAIKMVQFGLGRDDGDEHAFHCVIVDNGVQGALGEMVSATWQAMQNLTNAPVRYEPSEKHSGSDQCEKGDDDHRPCLVHDDGSGHLFEKDAFCNHEHVAQRHEVGGGLEPGWHIFNRRCKTGENH